MYKIYINDKPIFLQGFEDYNEGNDLNLSAVYMNKPVSLLQYIDSFEKTTKLASIHIYAKNLEKLRDDFFTLYQVVDAAGGIVMNKEGEILVIFRRGSWDIAKGKVDPGETIEDAAIREVMEETGIEGIKRKKLAGITYHTYLNKQKKRMLKRTYWYGMKAAKQELTPQTEEDIEKAEWVLPNEFLATYQPIFPNISEIVRKYIKDKDL